MTGTVGILHPGEMGAAIGAVLVSRGRRVAWASEGRSDGTTARARAAQLEDVGTVARLAEESDLVLSICPPAAALDTARSMAGFGGLYVDANAVAPETAGAVAAVVRQGGATFVDGGLVGRPPHHEGDVRLYLSGDDAGQVATLFQGSPVDARVIGPAIGAASALKCAYAAWTKGTTALLLAVRRYAEASGIADTLSAEWAESLPDLHDRLARAEASAQAKGWRWVAEMQEIAAAFESAGLPGGFHAGAAAIFTAPPEAGASDGTGASPT